MNKQIIIENCSLWKGTDHERIRSDGAPTSDNSLKHMVPSFETHSALFILSMKRNNAITFLGSYKKCVVDKTIFDNLRNVRVLHRKGNSQEILASCVDEMESLRTLHRSFAANFQKPHRNKWFSRFIADC